MASVGFSVVYWVLKYPRDDDVDLWSDDDVVSDSYKDEVTASKKTQVEKTSTISQTYTFYIYKCNVFII